MLRLCVAEVYVLELRLDVVEPELVGERDVEHQRLEDLPFLVLSGEHGKVAHNFETVCNLQDSDSRVGGVLDDEFLVVFRFEPCVLGFDGGNLVEAVDHGHDLPGEAPGGRVEVGMPPQCLMQEYGSHTLGGQPDLVGGDQGNSKRMLQERRPVIAPVVCQSSRCNVVGLVYQGFALIIVVGETC